MLFRSFEIAPNIRRVVSPLGSQCFPRQFSLKVGKYYTISQLSPDLPIDLSEKYYRKISSDVYIDTTTIHPSNNIHTITAAKSPIKIKELHQLTNITDAFQYKFKKISQDEFFEKLEDIKENATVGVVGKIEIDDTDTRTDIQFNRTMLAIAIGFSIIGGIVAVLGGESFIFGMLCGAWIFVLALMLIAVICSFIALFI